MQLGCRHGSAGAAAPWGREEGRKEDEETQMGPKVGSPTTKPILSELQFPTLMPRDPQAKDSQESKTLWAQLIG